MTTTFDNIQTRESRYVLHTYRRQPVAFVKGKGPRLYDVDGREYLDFVSGIGVASLGHAHPGLAAAVADQAATLLHTSNLYYHPFQAEAAARLSTLSGLSRAFFCNSGTEANEACLKFARRYWHTQGVSNRTSFVAIEHSFAGRTMGALSVTWDEHYRTPFEPLLGPVTFVDPNSPEALFAAVVALAFHEKLYRYAGLIVILLASGRVLIIDTVNLEPMPRVLAWLVLGLVMLALGFGYVKAFPTTRTPGSREGEAQ